MRRAIAILVPLVIVACSAAPSATNSPTASPPTTTPTNGPSPASPPTGAPRPTLEPTSSPAPEPTEPPPGPETTVPPFFGSVTLTTTGEPVPNSDLGGCGNLWNGATVYGSDDCGPHTFKLDAEPVVVAPGGTMTFAAPTGYEFSVDMIATEPGTNPHSWQVSIAPVSALEGLGEGEQEALTPQHGGRVLGYGERAVVSCWVRAPTTPGEYLVELDTVVTYGTWSWDSVKLFWRVSVR